MSAPTVAVRWLLARAAVRSTGLLHVVSERNTGALNPLCGANPIRSTTIKTQPRLTDAALLCEGCASRAASIGGTIEDGVAMLLGLSTSPTTARLLEVSVEHLHSTAELRPAGGRLIAAVRANGIVTPLLARRVGRGLLLLDGGRRLNAARAAGLTTVPVLVRDLDREAGTVQQLLGNLHHEELDPIAKGRAYAAALEVLGVKQAELAEGLGISPSQVSNTIRLLKLPEHLQERVAAGLITAEQARDLLACSSAEEQDALADRLLAGGRGRAGRAPDAQLAAIADLLEQALEAKVAVRTRGSTTEIVLRVPTVERARVLAQLAPTA